MKGSCLRGVAAAAVAALIGPLVIAELAAEESGGPPPQRGKVAPFVATPANVVSDMLRLAQVRSSDVVYDLGCGDGRIVITAAKLGRARGVGVDIDGARIAESERNAGLAGVTGRVRFVEEDLFRTDLREATVVTLYLLPEVNLRLRPKLLGELRPGARIVSNSYDLGDWTPDRTSARSGHPVHLWIVPANVSGRWSFRLPDGSERPYRMVIRQHYQKVRVAVSGEGRSLPVSGAQLRGQQLSFVLKLPPEQGGARVRFQGRVRGDALLGSLRSAAAQARLGVETGVGWRAHRDPSTVASIDGAGVL